MTKACRRRALLIPPPLLQQNLLNDSQVSPMTSSPATLLCCQQFASGARLASPVAMALGIQPVTGHEAPVSAVGAVERGRRYSLSWRSVVAVFLAAVSIAMSLPTIAAAPPRFESPWPGVHLVIYEELRLKSVVAEFDRFLAVVEVPHDDATARSLLALLKQRFPEKPLRFAFHTHHHEHSLGAVDALVEAGVTLVTTPWNLEQARQLSSRAASLDQHALVIGDRLSIGDGNLSLRAWELRKSRYRVPAEEYVVVELPGSKVLVTGCLFNKPLTYWEVVNGSKLALSQFISDAQLAPEWLVPTNTTREAGFESISAASMLGETLEKGLRPEDLAKRLSAIAPQDLWSSADAFARELGDRAHRSFDFIVCGNYLMTSQADYERAAFLFHLAAMLHPTEVDPLWFLGKAWSKLGNEPRAREAWMAALQLADDDETRALIAKALEGLS